MKNVAKFEETRQAVEDFKKQTEYLLEEAEEKFEKKGAFSKVYQKAFFKGLKTTQLDINRKSGIVTFDAPNIAANYILPIYSKKRRVNVVPLCCMVQLYKECTADIADAKSYEIPFTLRGFWRMGNAVECAAELSKLSTKSILCLSSYLNDKNVSEEKKKDINNLMNIIREFQVSPVKYGKYAYIDVTYKDATFSFKYCNVKLDIVPFCKMFCCYYVTVLTKINELQDSFGTNRTRLQQVETGYNSFMEKYFISRMCLK